MKKLFLTVALVAAGTLAHAQGTISIVNGTLWKTSVITPGVSTVATPTTTAINYGLFYGIGSGSSLTMLPTLGTSSTANVGIIVGSTGLQIPGTNPNDGNVFVQIKGWSASFGSDWQAAKNSSTVGTIYGETDIRNVGALGPSTGPGVAIWQMASGTDTHKFAPLSMTAVVPEPSTMALAGLGAAALLIFRRRK